MVDQTMESPQTSSQRITSELIISAMPDSAQRQVMQNILGIQDEKERNRQIALWACDYGFDELVYTPSPQPPQQLLNFRGLTEDKKSKLLSDTLKKGQNFFERTQIKAFIEGKWRKNLRNIRNYEWLKQIKDWLDGEKDLEQIKMIRVKINEFETSYRRETEKPFPALDPFYVWPTKKEEVQEFI